MRVRLRGPLATFELCPWSAHEPGDGEIVEVTDELVALGLLRRIVAEGEGWALRSLAADAGLELGGLGLGSELGSCELDDEDLADALAGALVRGTIVVVRTPHEILASEPVEIIEQPLEPAEPEPIQEFESVFMSPGADAEWIGLSVAAEPEVLDFEASHHAP